MKIIKTSQTLDMIETLSITNQRELVRALRDAIIGEQTAIKQYENIIDAIKNKKIKKILQSIADEEKTHVFEIQILLNSLAPDEKKFLNKAKTEISENC